jgi:predicted AlkP superfamily phosphohydrolase/phosphomutase
MRVGVVGMDGADWRLLRPWIERGELPAIARLVREGAVGPLRSTVRPESSVAWSSFATGVNPGKHGVLGFAERVAGSYSFRLASGASIRVPRFWELAGERGLSVGLLNVPFTYPPSPVNGFLVTGMLTPGTHVPFTHPPQLGARLIERFGDWKFDVGDWGGDKGVLVERVRLLTRQQRDAALFLLREQPRDLFIVVFEGGDRLQHILWADADECHPLHDPGEGHRFGGALLAHYRELDDAVSAIVETLPGDTLIFLVSDHGFNGCARRFHVNRWLAEQDLLAPAEGGPGAASLLLRAGSSGWLRHVKRALFPARWDSLGLRCAAFARSVDWPRTRAFFGADGGVRINLRGREPQGLVPPGEYDAFRDGLRRELLAVRDPETGRPVFSAVFTREELYSGPALETAPDLVAEPRRDGADAGLNVVLDGSLEPHGIPAFGLSLPHTGNHAPEGILVAWGEGVAEGRRVEGASIIDLAPTILAALGVAAPPHVDGRVLAGLFAPDGLARPRPVEIAGPGLIGRPAPSFGRDDEALVEERLANLGYLS